MKNKAYYKRSGKPWTDDDLEAIAIKEGTRIPTKNKSISVYHRKFIYYFIDEYTPWEKQAITNLQKIAFEDVFETSKETNPHSEYEKALQSYKGFKPGMLIKRIGSSKPGLPFGYKTELLHIWEKEQQVRLIVKDSTGKLRPYCGVASWKPIKYPTPKYKVGHKLRTSFPRLYSQDKIVTINKIENDKYYYSNSLNESGFSLIEHVDLGDYFHDDVTVISDKKNLAFYKRSALPWTDEEIKKVCTYCGEDSNEGFVSIIQKSRKWIFSDGTKIAFMYTWGKQEKHPNFKNCQQVAYEDIFPTIGYYEKQTIEQAEQKLNKKKSMPYIPKYKIGDVLDVSKSWLHLRASSQRTIADITNGYYYFNKGKEYSTCKNIDNNPNIHLVTTTPTTADASINSKENTMNSITVTMTAKELKAYEAKNKPSAPKTELQRLPKALVVMYSPTGTLISCTPTSFSKVKLAVKDSKSKLQQPSNLGKTYAIYTHTKSFTTKVPVVEI